MRAGSNFWGNFSTEIAEKPSGTWLWGYTMFDDTVACFLLAYNKFSLNPTTERSLSNSKAAISGEDPFTVLQELRNVPRQDGYSPAQLLFGRSQRTSLPTIPRQNTINFEAAAKCKDQSQITASKHHDKHKFFLPPLSPGQYVTVQDPQSGNWHKKWTCDLYQDRWSIIFNWEQSYEHTKCFDPHSPDLLTWSIPPFSLLFTKPSQRPLRPLPNQLCALNLLHFLFADHNAFVIRKLQHICDLKLFLPGDVHSKFYSPDFN